MRPKSKKPVSAPKPAFVKSFPTNKSHPSMLLSPVPWRNCKSSVDIPNKAQKVYEQELTFRKAEETEEQKIHEAIAQTAGGVVQAAGLGQTQGPALPRYMQHFPAAGEVVIFDRSWYNRAGVEHVMGFCSPEQHKRFLELCPITEKFIVDGNIRLIKYWMEVGKKEQQRRFEARIKDPLRQWKLSPMDLPSWRRWDDYTRARDGMLQATDTPHAPWHIVRSDDKKKARLNC